MRTGFRTIRVRRGTAGRFASGGSFSSSNERSRWWWALLLLVPVAAMIVAAAGIEADRNEPLASFVLTGERSPACLRTVVFRDQSGSMSGFEISRDSAMTQLVAWSAAPGTMRGTDELAIIDFAADSAIALETRPIADPGQGIPPSAVTDADGTDLSQGIALMRQLPPTVCHTSLVVLSDGLIDPLTIDARKMLAAQNVTDVALILPGSMIVPDVWKSAFPYGISQEASASDPNQTARAVAATMAASVGQRLEKR